MQALWRLRNGCILSSKVGKIGPVRLSTNAIYSLMCTQREIVNFSECLQMKVMINRVPSKDFDSRKGLEI